MLFKGVHYSNFRASESRLWGYTEDLQIHNYESTTLQSLIDITTKHTYCLREFK